MATENNNELSESQRARLNFLDTKYKGELEHGADKGRLQTEIKPEGEAHPGSERVELPEYERPSRAKLDPNVDYNPRRIDFWRGSFWYQNRTVQKAKKVIKPTSILFGVLDVLPIPNVHQIVRSVLRDFALSSNGRPDTMEVIREVLDRIDLNRTIVNIAIGMLIMWLIWRALS